MNDTLRDRIAAVLLPSTDHCQQSMTRPCDDCMDYARKKADAVIAALSLTVEAEVIVGCLHPATRDVTGHTDQSDSTDLVGQSASLRDRMIYAILDVLTDDDPPIMVEFSPNELRITIPSDPEPTVTT